MRFIILLTYLLIPFSLAAENNEYIIEVNDQFISNNSHSLTTFGYQVQNGNKKFVTQLNSSELSELKNQIGVTNIVKNIKLSLFKSPDDLSDRLWGLKNPNKAQENIDINVTPVWDITTGSKDIIVAVIDTGAFIDHNDLIDNLWTNEAEMNGVTGEDDDGNGYVDDVFGYDFPKNSPILGDRVGHGTHVSGTIGAKGNNGNDVVGVNWDVSIMTLNMFPDNGQATLDDALKAIDYAINNGANVINASWGGPAADPNDEEEVKAYEMLKEKIEDAGKAGIIFIAASGNDSVNTDNIPMYPASFDSDSIISIGSISSSGRRSFFSNYGKTTVDVFAPGSGILSTTKNGRTGKLSGTSMAAPHVAGIAALLLSAVPDASVAELKDAIVNTCRANSNLEGRSVCEGHVDTHAALKQLMGETE